MQPCSQPRYGLMDRSNGKSGEVLRVMMVLAVSIRTSVPWVGGTSWYQPSSSATLTVGAKRLCRLVAVPRPRGGGGGGAEVGGGGGPPPGARGAAKKKKKTLFFFFLKKGGGARSF